VDLDLPAPQGHAIEVRLYAEDPAHDWQPQSGTLDTLELPGVVAEFEQPSRYGVRLDSGFESGSEVSTYYDAMLAKVIAWAPTRREAARMLATTLSRARLHGVTTNRDLLVATLRDDEFLAGLVSTDFFERRAVVPVAETLAPSEHLLFAAAVALAERDRETRTVQHGVPVGWRNVVSQPQRTVFAVGDAEHVVGWFGGRDGYLSADGGSRVLAASSSAVTLEVDRVSSRFDVVIGEPEATGARPVYVDGPHGSTRLLALPRFTDPADAVASGSLLAPMPGTVVRVEVEAGARVEAGQPVLVLEAMKMQHTVSAPHAGVVTEIDVKPGAQVAAGEVLAVVEEAWTTDESEEA
jgi:propionyl-CoA carboxylase alpha chain